MSRYTFTFKKDDIFVEFTTEDKDVVERQFQIWVSHADEYAKTHKKGQTSVNSEESKPETVQTQQEPEKNVIFQQKAQPAVSPEPVKTEPAQEVQNVEVPASTLRTINDIQNDQQPAKEEKSVEIPEFQQEPEENQPQESTDFENVLEQKIETPTFEAQQTKDQVFLNLVQTKNTADKFHYLIITAYYLSEFEKKERFTLKQINAKLMQNLSEVIDHTMLQEALSQGLLELVPDLTGVSEIGEYKLTMAGEEFFAKNIG